MEAFRKMLRGKLHGLTITHANKDYEGSICLPPELIEAAGFVPNEAVQVWNITSGTRLETYVLRGIEGSKDVAINGAAAHLIAPGDKVIVAAFGWFPEHMVALHQPKVVFMAPDNSIKEQRIEKPFAIAQ